MLGVVWRKVNPLTLLVGMLIGTPTLEKEGHFYKTKSRTTMWYSNPTPGYISREKPWFEKVHLSKRSLKHYLEWTRHGSILSFHWQWMDIEEHMEMEAFRVSTNCTLKITDIINSYHSQQKLPYSGNEYLLNNIILFNCLPI